MNAIKVGTVLKLHRPYSNPKFKSDPKERYFVYIGKTSTLDTDEVYAILATTTTQVQKYESNGERANHLHINFKEGESGFEKDCILDLEVIDHNIKYDDIINTSDVEILGEVSIEKLKIIHNRLMDNSTTSNIIKSWIHDSFEKTNIKGLCKLKKHKKRGRN